jgi:hypothetical protein
VTGASVGWKRRFVNEKRGLFLKQVFTTGSIHDKKQKI